MIDSWPLVLVAVAATLWLLTCTWSAYRTERDRHTRAVVQLTALHLQVDRDRRDLGA